MSAPEDVTHSHVASSVAVGLKCNRPVEAEHSALGFYFEFSLVRERDMFSARELKTDCFRLRPGMNHKVVFQLAAGAVVHKINAGINVFVLHLLEVGDIGVPSLGITAEKVTALPREFVFPG